MNTYNIWNLFLNSILVGAIAPYVILRIKEWRETKKLRANASRGIALHLEYSMKIYDLLIDQWRNEKSVNINILIGLAKSKEYRCNKIKENNFIYECITLNAHLINYFIESDVVLQELYNNQQKLNLSAEIIRNKYTHIKLINPSISEQEAIQEAEKQTSKEIYAITERMEELINEIYKLKYEVKCLLRLPAN